MKKLIKSALKIYYKLLEKGQIDNKNDSELFFEYKKDEVRELLYQFEEELEFKLLDVGNTVYLIPNLENDILGYSMKDFRENIASNATMTEAYLQSYIFMTIFFLFYGGKNTNPIQREFILTRDLIEYLDNRMQTYVDLREESEALEEKYSVNFLRVAEFWLSKQVASEGSRKTKVGTILKAYSQLEKEKLIRVLEDGNQIRREKKLDDIFIYYYLDENRIKEIQSIFEKKVENHA